MRITFPLLAMALLCACGVDQIEVTLAGRVDVPGSHQRSAVLLPDVPIEGLTEVRFSGTKELASAGVSGVDIERVHLDSLSLQPAGEEDLDFIEYVQIFARAPGQPEVPVAERHVPDGAHGVDLEVTDEDLAPYGKAKNMTLRASMQLRRQPQEAVPVRVTAHFLVDVASVGP